MKGLIFAVSAAVVLAAGLTVAWFANPFSYTTARPADEPTAKVPQKPKADPAKPDAQPPKPVTSTEPPVTSTELPGVPPEAKPEPLPPVPVADPKSKLTPLNKEKTLYIEKTPAGQSRVLFASEVCLRHDLMEVLLEVFLCKTNTKEHEAILRTSIDARFLHAALIAAGATVGTPVQFLDPKTGDAKYKAASGQTIRVLVNYTLKGKAHTHPAQEWILDKKTKKPMAHEWVFAGSRFVKDPERPNAPDYYTANNGEVICISNFGDSMLDLPIAVSREANELQFDAMLAKIPPLGSKVWVILEPVSKKK